MLLYCAQLKFVAAESKHIPKSLTPVGHNATTIFQPCSHMLLDISPIESVHIFERAFSGESANQKAPYAEIYGDSAAIHGFRNFPNDFRALILRIFSRSSLNRLVLTEA